MSGGGRQAEAMQRATPPRPQPYGFVKPSLICLFTLVDTVGYALTAPFRRRTRQDDPQRIVLINLAHIGDVLLTTAAIAAVRDRLPQAHLAMLVSPWSQGVIVN